MYEFTDRAGDLDELVLSTFDHKLILPGENNDEIRLFQNGDIMTINTAEKTMTFDGLDPTHVASSRLNFIRHKWFVNGVIRTRALAVT